jgi:hypothetical protein
MDLSKFSGLLEVTDGYKYPTVPRSIVEIVNDAVWISSPARTLRRAIDLALRKLVPQTFHSWFNEFSAKKQPSNLNPSSNTLSRYRSCQKSSSDHQFSRQGTILIKSLMGPGVNSNQRIVQTNLEQYIFFGFSSLITNQMPTTVFRPLLLTAL